LHCGHGIEQSCSSGHGQGVRRLHVSHKNF
jgi:hypothetical protein